MIKKKLAESTKRFGGDLTAAEVIDVDEEEFDLLKRIEYLQ